MGRDYFLDKDIIITRDNSIYMVYSNVNPFGYVYAYLKYVYTGKGLWKGYERVLRYYGVHNLMKLKQEFIFEPCYDVSFPILRKSDILFHLKPEEKMDQILRHTEDKLEEIVVEIYDKIKLKEIGITGSILAGIHHKSSDIDIVIYGSKNALDYLSEEGFDEDKDWIVETMRNYDLPLELVKEMYDKRVRGIYKGYKVSVLFVNPYPARYCEKVCKRIEEGEIIGEVYDNSEALFYPSQVYLSSVSLLKGEYKPTTLISFEGIYSMLLFKSRRIYARGMLMKCNDDEVRLIIGDRDVKGIIKRIL